MGAPSPTDGDLHARVRRREVVADLGQQALETDDLDGLLRDATGAIAETLDSECCAVFERLPNENEGKYRAGIGRDGTERVPMGPETLSGAALRTAEPVVTDDLRGDDRFTGAEWLADRDVTGGLGVPIDAAGDPWGVLAVYTTDRRPLTDDAVEFVRRVADLLGSAIGNLRARRDREGATDSSADATERERTRRRLETERDVFAAGPAIVFRWRNEPGWPVEYVSENVEDVLGYAPAELESGSVPYTDLLLEAEIDRIAAEVAEHSNETTERFGHEPYRVRTADGDVRWVKDTTKIVRDDDGEITHYLGYLVDITERKERERALRRKERQFEAVFEDPNILVGLLDPDGTVRDINGTAMEYIDADLADVTGKPFWETPWWGEGDETRADVKRWTERAADGEYVDFETDLTRPNGQQYTLEGYFRPVTNDDGDVVSVIVSDRDVTERKERERQLATLMDNVPGMVYRCENERDWPMEFVSDACEELTGYDAEALEAGDVSWGEDVMVQADRQKLWETVQRETDEGETFSETYRIETADGDRRWVRDYGRGIFDDGELVGIEGIIADITERKRLESELEESERRYRTLVEQFPNGAVALVDEDLRYRTVGGNPVDVADVTTDEVEGEPVRDALPSALADELAPRYEAALEGESSAFEATSNGRVYNFHVVPVRDDDGDPFAALGMSQDVTERYEYERELEDAKSQLEAATEAGAVGTWEWHIPEDRMVTGATFAETFGVDPEAARDGVSLDRFISSIHEDDRDRVAAEIEAAVESGGEYEAEYRVRNADGEIRWVVARGRVECDEDGEPVRFPGALTDITERKRAELELERTNEELETLFDVLPVGVVVADADGQLLRSNDTAKEIWGGDVLDAGSVAEYEKYSIWWADSGERATPEELTLSRVLEGEEVTDPDIFEIEAADGQRRIIRAEGMPIRNERGEVTRGVATISDITERREYQRQLEESEQRYRTLVDNFPNGAVALFDEDLRYRIVGGTALEELEDSSETIVGKHVRERYPPELADRMEAKFEAALAGESSSFEIEFHDRDWMAYTVPIRDDAGEIFGGMIMVQDITDQKERERELRERERRLEESERRYRTLAQHFPNGAVGVYDRDLEYTLAEGGELGETLPSAERLEGNRMPDIFPEHTVADLEPLFRAAVEDGETDDVQTAFGGRVWRVWATPLHDADGEIFAGLSFAQDVTERVDREKHLERYETIVEVVDDGVYVVDADGRFTMVNDTYAAMLGYEPDDLVGEHVSLVVDDAVAERVRELEADPTADEWPTVEAELRTADGDTVPVEANFAMLPEDDDSAWHRVGVARDISDRKARERELEESERRYRTLVENFPDGAVGLYDEDLEYIVVGGEAFDDLDIEEAEVAGATLDERYPDDLVAEIEPNFRAVFDGESNTFEYRAHGRDVWAHTLPVRNEDDEIFAGMVMVQDITDRREYERKLEESNERLERFAYAASHDLQEPLRMVTSYLQLLENRYGDAFDEDGEEFLAFAVDGAERMRDMIDGLLEYSRVETRGDPFEPVELDAVLDDVLADLQLRIEETDAEISVADLPRVEADAGQLRQVFQNLLENAVTYSGDEPPRVHVDAERRGDEWVLSVHDEGVGIDPDDQDRVFTIFDRLHSREEYDGTGIGLALCERIVERHGVRSSEASSSSAGSRSESAGGEIWVESEPGEGSTFSFTLPVSREE